MNSTSGWILVMTCLVGATASLASITLEFTKSLTNRVIGVPIQLDFSIDGSGQVTLEQIDRYLDPGTYRAGFTTNEAQKSIRIQGVVP